MEEFDLDVDFNKIITMLKSAMFNCKTELQLVWLYELIINIIIYNNTNYFKNNARRNKNGRYLLSQHYIVRSIPNSNYRNVLLKLATFRNKFCHEGWLSARKELKSLLADNKELVNLAVSYGVEIDLDNLQFNYI